MTAGAKTSSVFCQLHRTKVIFAQRRKLSALVSHLLETRRPEGEFDRDEGPRNGTVPPRIQSASSVKSKLHSPVFKFMSTKRTASGAVISTSGTRPWLLTLFSTAYVTFDSGAHCFGLFGFFRKREEAGGTDTGKSLSHPEDIPPAFPTGTQRNGVGD